MKMTNPKLPKRIRNHVNPLADQIIHEFDGFDNDNPIIIDIGSYRGEFIASLEQKFGESKNYIACEIRKPYAVYLKELFSDKEHIEVFDGDSAKNLKTILEPSQNRGVHIEYVFINFPDPWFKDRHKKRRVVSDTFLKETKKWISPKTIFVFQTDQEELFNDTQELLREEGISSQRFSEPLWGIQTHWEQMKVSEGHKIFRMKFSYDS